MKSKWFEILVDEKEKRFESIEDAKTLKEAWDKTLEKWELITQGFSVGCYHEETCGLCNIHGYNYNSGYCPSCPVQEMSRGGNCKGTPFSKWESYPTIKNANLEYLFLLFVREATK